MYITIYRGLWIKTIWWHSAYVSVLVGSDSYELGLWEVEALSLYVIANVLHPILRHLHDVQPRLVLVQRLQHNHLHKRNHPLVFKN